MGCQPFWVTVGDGQRARGPDGGRPVGTPCGMEGERRWWQGRGETVRMWRARLQTDGQHWLSRVETGGAGMSRGISAEQQGAQAAPTEVGEGGLGAPQGGGWAGTLAVALSPSRCSSDVQGEHGEGQQPASLDVRMNLGAVPSKEEKPQNQSKLERTGVWLGEPCLHSWPPRPLREPVWEGPRLPGGTGVSLGGSTTLSGDGCSAGGPRVTPAPGRRVPCSLPSAVRFPTGGAAHSCVQLSPGSFRAAGLLASAG